MLLLAPCGRGHSARRGAVSSGRGQPTRAGTGILSPYASMAPAGGKVSPTASNAPISARAPSPRPLERKRGRRTRQREAPLLRGRLDDERRLTGGTHLGARRLRHPWYDSGMTQKIAVSLPDEQVVSIRRAVEQGRAPSVSGFISAAVARVQREDDLAQLLDDLDRELGPVDDADLAWADKALGLA